MTISAQELINLKDKVTRLNEVRIRAESARDEALARLKELGYDSVEDAEAALDDMKKAIVDEEVALAEDVDKLLDTYPDLR